MSEKDSSKKMAIASLVVSIISLIVAIIALIKRPDEELNSRGVPPSKDEYLNAIINNNHEVIDLFIKLRGKKGSGDSLILRPDEAVKALRGSNINTIRKYRDVIFTPEETCMNIDVNNLNNEMIINYILVYSGKDTIYQLDGDKFNEFVDICYRSKMVDLRRIIFEYHKRRSEINSYIDYSDSVKIIESNLDRVSK